MEQKSTSRCHLSAIMGDRKMKIVDVMNASGVGRFQVTRLYREEHMEAITLGTCVKIADGLDVSLDELISYTPAKKNSRIRPSCKQARKSLTLDFFAPVVFKTERSPVLPAAGNQRHPQRPHQTDPRR